MSNKSATPSLFAPLGGVVVGVAVFLGVNITTGQTLYLRVYPYNTSAATSGKTIMLANVVISAVTN